MEFLLFLTSKEKEILELIYKAGFSVEENTPLCFLGEKYVGFIKKRQRSVVICTENIKKSNGYLIANLNNDNSKERTSISIRKALRHEATHVAQHCNNSNLLGLLNKKVKRYKWYKKSAIIRSTSIGNGNTEKEEEAYYMEDRPREVITALKRY